MVLAAGRGERMRPLTDERPKPLLEVGGATLIEHQVRRLADAGVERVVVNLAWLGHMIRDHLGDGSRLGVEVRYSEEPEGALESAGGIREALDLIADERFLVVNGDVWCDVDLGRLSVSGGDLATLIMVPNPPHNADGDFALEAGRLRQEGPERFTFSGLGAYHRAMFRDLEPGRRPLAPLLRDAMAADRVAGVLHRGAWTDVGTPQRLEALRSRLEG